MPSNNFTIKIGTRKSKLALFQANHLKNSIENLGLKSELCLIDSKGDLDQNSKLQNFSQTGVFTNALDSALLENDIHLGIHSLKDYPTVPTNGISVSSYGKRENPYDVLVKNSTVKNINEETFHIATGSIRRKAQWKYKYDDTSFYNLRGNVPTRLEKLYDSNWDGIILAYAGLERLGLLSNDCITLDWMIPAPAQGVLGVTYKKENTFISKIIEQLKDDEVELCSTIERLFLNKLEGGCSAPIGALASLDGQFIQFNGSLHSIDGMKGIYIEKKIARENALKEVELWVNEVLESGGREIMNNLKNK